jgi:hypothetical protein
VPGIAPIISSAMVAAIGDTPQDGIISVGFCTVIRGRNMKRREVGAKKRDQIALL